MKNPEAFFSEFFYIHYFPENIFFISLKKNYRIKKKFSLIYDFFDF